MPQGRYSYRKSEPSEYQTRMDTYRRELAQTPDPEPETWGHWFGHTAAPAAIRTVPAIAGGIAGATLGPLGVAGVGAAGAGLGSLGAQAYEKWLGDRQEYNPIDVAIDTGMGAIPVAKYAKGAGMLARAGIHAAQGVGMGGGHTVLSTLANKGELPTLGEVGESAAIGGVLGGGIGALSRGRPRGSVVEPPNTSGRLLTGTVESAEIGAPRNPFFKAPWDRPPRVTVDPIAEARVTNPNAPMGPVGPAGLPPRRTPQLEETPGRSVLPQRGLPPAKSPYATIPDKELEGLVTFGDEEAWQELSKRGRVRPAGPSSLERKPIPMGPSSLPPEPEVPDEIRPILDKLRKSLDKDAQRRQQRQLGAREEIAPIAPEEGLASVAEVPRPAPRPVGRGRSLGATPPEVAPPGAGILTRSAALQVPPRIGQPVDMPEAVPGRPMSGPRGPMPGLEPVGEVGQPPAPLAPPAPARLPVRAPQTPQEYDAAIKELEDRLYNTDVGEEMEGPLYNKLERLVMEREELVSKTPPMADVYPPRAAIPGFDTPNFPAPAPMRTERMPSIGEVQPQGAPKEGLGARARRRAQRESGAAGRLPFAEKLRDERGMVDLTGETGIPPLAEVAPVGGKEILGDVPPIEAPAEPIRTGLGAKISEKLKQAQEAFKKSKLSDERGSVQLEGKNYRKVVGSSKRDVLTASGELPDERNILQKFGNKIGERLAETRTYKAGGDVSAVLRQGGHFKTRKFFYESLPAAYKTLMSQEGAEEAEKNLKKRIYTDAKGQTSVDKKGNDVTSYNRAKESGIYLSDAKNLEESIISKAAELGPLPEGSKASKVYQDTIGSVYKRTNAFHGAFLNELRVRAFEKMTKGAKPEEIPAIVKYINSSTGRGELKFKNPITGNKHDFEGAATTLNKLFFSARFAKSRLDLMNPRIYKEAFKNPTVFKNAWRDLAGNVAYVTAANALAHQAGLDVTIDPRSPDFGKVKVGSSRIDFANGMQPYIRLLAQVTSLSKVSSVTGNKIDLNTDKFGAPTVLDTIEKFGEGKLAPVPRFLAKVARGKQITGEELNYTTLNLLNNEFAKLFSPMAADDIIKLMQHDPEAAWMGLLALGGDSLQTYGEDRGSKKTKSSGSTVAPRTIRR